MQVEVTTLLAANKPGGQIRSDFAAFPTPAFAKVNIYILLALLVVKQIVILTVLKLDQSKCSK